MKHFLELFMKKYTIIKLGSERIDNSVCLLL